MRPYKETQDYVAKMLRIPMRGYENRGRAGAEQIHRVTNPHEGL